MRILAVACTIALASIPVWADVIHLNAGGEVKGDRIVKMGDGWDVYEGGKKIQHVMLDNVRSIELTPRGNPADDAAGKLGSLRRSVEALPDIKMVIDRYEKFIEQNRGQAIAEDAKKDLALWKDRLAKGLVKVGGKWITAEEKSQMQEKSLAVADQARDLLKQNKLKEAEAQVDIALAGDPANASSLYMKGLILYRQDKVPQARQAFEKVKEAMPDHGPTLNNLAVILWRQNQQIGALNYYYQAMQAMPGNKELLNNVAEALNALPDKDKSGVVPQKVYKLWTEQDNQLQQQLMPMGWYRWGGTWVDRATYEKLQAAEKEVKDKITKLETEFADAQAKVTTIDAQIQANRDAMVYMERSRYAQDAQGRMVSYPLPPQYWDYDRANRRLDVQRQEAIATLDKLRAQAQAVRGNVPVPKFTGVQTVVGVEGTPAIVPAPGTVKPVTPVGGVGVTGASTEVKGVEVVPAATPTPTPTPGNLLEEVGGKKGEKPLKY